MGTQAATPLVARARPDTLGSIGEPCLPCCKLTGSQIRRRIQRLWPAHDYRQQAVSDPWGAAYQRAAREDTMHVFFYRAPYNNGKPSPSFESDWAGWEQSVRDAGKHARALTGQEALQEIMACLCLGSRRSDRNCACPSLPRRMSTALSALLYIACGHKRGELKAHPIGGVISVCLGRNKRRVAKFFGRFSTLAAAVEAIQSLPLPKAARKKRAFPVSFGANGWKNQVVMRVYPLKDNGAEAFGIGCMAGAKNNRHRIVLKKFETRKAADNFLRSKKPEVFRLLQRWSNLPFGGHGSLRGDAIRWRSVRQGPRRRTGNVTAGHFFQTFAPKGITFGEDVDSAHRQRMLNILFDQAADLAELIGCAPADLFFRGGLGLALGLAAQRNSLAHYSFRQRHIFLNKENGGNSFVHEWFHALDHFVSLNDRRTGSKFPGHTMLNKSFVETLCSARDRGRPSYVERTDNLEKRVFMPHYAAVWKYNSELAARAFEALARREAVRRNWRHTPVAGRPDWHLWRQCGVEQRFHYPTPRELTRCADGLWGLVREGLAGVLNAADKKNAATLERAA